MKRATNLYKAQMGGGTEQNESYKQLTTAIYSAIKRGQSPNDVYTGLLNQKINKDIALKLVSGVVEYMISNGELEEEEMQQQNQQKAQEEQQRMQEQQMAQQDTIVDNWSASSPEQGDDYAQQMADANQQSMDIVNEDAEDTEDLLGFQDGGEQAVIDQYDEVDESGQPEEIVDYSKLIASTPGTQNVQFPGLEEYYYQYNPLLTEDFQLNYDEAESEEEPQMAKFGGVKTKRKFTNEVLKLLKRQAGGEGAPQEDEVVNSAKAKQTDDLTNTVKKVKGNFVNAVSGQAKKVVIGDWFEKLKQNNDPMLDQILNPPPKENPLEQKMQQDQQMQEELSGNQMQRGGSNRQYKRLAKKIYNQMGSMIPIPKGFNVPVSYYDKRAPFVNQRFSTIGGPQINKYFELLAKMYPKAKSAPAQAEEAVIKNNMVDDVVNNSGYTGIDANPLWAQLNNFNTPLNPYQTGGEYAQDMQMIGQYGGYTGSKDPSVPPLTRFIQGGGDQFPEESKNVNDPYFSDMTPYPQMQNGGDPTEFTHYTHGADNIFQNNMNMTVKAEDGMQVGANPYLQQLQQMLQNSKYSPRDIRRGMRNQRRMSGNTYRDLLFPANRAIQYSGSWAQQMGLPFLGENGETYLGDVNGPLAKREVTKRGILGRPKEWTDYYMVGDDGTFSSLDPSNTNKITLDPYKQRVAAENKANDKALQPRGTYRDLGLINQARIRSNERQADRRTSNEPDVDPGYEPMSNEEMLKSQGKIWNEKTKKWVPETSFMPDDFGDGSDETFDPPVSTAKPSVSPSKTNSSSSTNSSSRGINGMTDSPGMVGKTDAEIRQALIKGESIPTVVNKGNTVYINAAGTPIDLNDPIYADEEEEETDYAFGGYIPDYMAYGGYLQKATFGLENTPVSYTGNPAFAGQTEVDMTVNNDGNTNLQPSSFWGDQQSFNTPAPAAPKEMQQQNEELTKYNVDPNQIEEYQAPKQFQGLVGVKRKRQDMTTIDPEAGVNTFNAGVKGALGAIDNMRSRKQEADMYAKNFDPTQIYGKKERIDKGDWDVNTGMYRTNETGANRLGRSKKFGGYMQEGGIPEGMFYPEDNMIYPPGDSQYPMVPLNQDIMDMMYNQYYSDPNFTPYEEDPYMEEAPEETDYRMVAEGGETYMSDEQINAFLAAGGEIEYL
jgi:hypothetical protein